MTAWVKGGALWTFTSNSADELPALPGGNGGNDQCGAAVTGDGLGESTVTGATAKGREPRQLKDA